MAPPMVDDEGRKGQLRRLSGDENRDGDRRGSDGWSSGAHPGISYRDTDHRPERTRGPDREIGGAHLECLHHQQGGKGRGQFFWGGFLFCFSPFSVRRLSFFRVLDFYFFA